MSIIQEMFSGSLFPAENNKPSSPEYAAAREASLKLALEMNNHLDKEQRDLWDRYIDALTCEQGLCYAETFRQGMVIGARLIVELLL